MWMTMGSDPSRKPTPPMVPSATSTTWFAFGSKAAICPPLQLAPPEHWPLRVVVAVTSEAAKETGSTAGMRRTASTSPYFDSFVTAQPGDLDEARAAIRERDFDRLATVTEASCLKMHAAMMTATPSLLYWLPASVAVIEEVRRLRSAGTPACFTMDAGPQVKVVCAPDAAARVEQALLNISGVQRVLVSELGEGAR